MSSWAKLPLAHRLSRYVNSWERNRPRLIRRRILDFPPIPCQPHATMLAVLCEGDKFTDGLWCAWSWMRFLHRHVRLHLFVDGAIPAEHRDAFTRLFPGAELSSMPEFLAAQPAPSPSFQTFLDGYRYARKLSLILHLQQTSPVLYTDSDVIAFRRPDALLTAIEANIAGAYIADPGSRTDQTCVDPWIRGQAAKLSLPCVTDLNSGLLWMPRGSIDPGLVERLLTGWHAGVYYHFAEQTILAVLFGASGAQPLPEKDYVLSGQGMHFWEQDLPCDGFTVRHYVGLVRHRMYSHAYPFLLRQLKDLRPE